MLAVFYGTDTIAVRQRATAYAHERITADTEISSIDASEYQQGMLAEAAEGASLFGGTHVYIIDTPSTDDAFAEEVAGLPDRLAASPHIFIVIEGAIPASVVKSYRAHANLVEEYKRTADATFNTFALADALANRDKKTLWLLLADARRVGRQAEEVAGMLWWQLKSLNLAARAASPDAAGMKPFPFSKAKRSLARFPDDELEALSTSFLAMYHDARLGGLDLDLALERWVLRL